MNRSTKSLSPYALVVLGVLFMSAPLAFAGRPSAKVDKKEWALLTYLNGFNSLDSFGYLDMNEMEKVGSTPRVHVVSQWASLKTKEVHRVYVNKDSDPSTVTSPVVENLGKIDMGDYRSLIDFVKWSVKNYPADHYFVNVWNHGNGWHFTGTKGVPPSTRDLSYDDLSGNKITTEQLGQALAELSAELGKKIDVFGSDSCLMAMAEVAGEMKGSVGQFIGSEEVEPADGWPYDTLLTKWNAGGAKSPADVANILTQVYVDSYKNGQDATLSGMDLAKYGPLASAVRDLADAIKSEPASVRQKILQAVGRTQSYTSDDYKDLGDFVDVLAKDTSINLRPDILAGVKTALKAFVNANRTTTAMAKSQGVSIWFPDSAWEFGTYKERYRAMTFNQDTGWIDAITATLGGANLL